MLLLESSPEGQTRLQMQKPCQNLFHGLWKHILRLSHALDKACKVSQSIQAQFPASWAFNCALKSQPEPTIDVIGMAVAEKSPI